MYMHDQVIAKFSSMKYSFPSDLMFIYIRLKRSWLFPQEFLHFNPILIL